MFTLWYDYADYKAGYILTGIIQKHLDRGRVISIT